ncbi:MAG: phosphoribosylglycinamide formyltransferase [Xanthomonadaceae bacterium]|nr:phosphoribosylglycinamide formyltransferase [Xanthomonadaceae bacterium]
MPSPTPIAVLASGRGSNLGALIDARREGRLAADIVLVAGDTAAAPARRRAEAEGIATLALDPQGYPDRRSYDLALFERVAASGAALVVLAGFMRVLDAAALAPWAGRMINLHPSLLPKYRGLHTHRRVLEAGDAEHGASVHFVTPELDGGPLIAQVRMPVLAGDSAESLAARLQPLEHRLLVACVAALVTGCIALRADGVHADDRRLDAPLQLAVDGSLQSA